MKRCPFVVVALASSVAARPATAAPQSFVNFESGTCGRWDRRRSAVCRRHGHRAGVRRDRQRRSAVAAADVDRQPPSTGLIVQINPADGRWEANGLRPPATTSKDWSAFIAFSLPDHEDSTTSEGTVTVQLLWSSSRATPTRPVAAAVCNGVRRSRSGDRALSGSARRSDELLDALCRAAAGRGVQLGGNRDGARVGRGAHRGSRCAPPG